MYSHKTEISHLIFAFIALSMTAPLLEPAAGLYGQEEATAGSLINQPIRFDFGPDGSAVADGDVALTVDHIYSTDKGFGWTTAPEKPFTFSPRLDGSRDDRTIDGVQGKRLVFRTDLTPGKWWITLWADAGTEDQSTLQLIIGGMPRSTGWHTFTPSSEPRTSYIGLYRIYHGSVEVGADGLDIELIGGHDPALLLGLSLIPDPQAANETQEWVLQRLREAGAFDSKAPFTSLNSDLARMKLEDPSDAFAAYWLEHIEILTEAEKLRELAGWEWVKDSTGQSIFGRFHQVIMLLDGLLSPRELDSYPLYERALWNRGRMHYWMGVERHGIDEINAGERDLAAMYALHPDSDLVAMYNGEKIDLPDPYDDIVYPSNAPAWSSAQREALLRMRDIAYWWIKDRQLPNGELGGKLDDDVETLRWWISLIYSGDTTVLEGWRKLADGVWYSPRIYQGFSKAVRDVEHSSEYICDTAPMMVVFSDDPVYLERLRYSADYFTNLWTDITPSGRRFFKSAWLSSTDMDIRPPRNRDVPMNSRAVMAVRYLAWKTGDTEAIKTLHEWSLAWVNAAMRTDKGKPAGIIPPSIRFPDEALNGDETSWVRANMYWDYYDWGGGAMMLDQLLFTYTLTKDETLLKPLHSTLELIRKHVENGDADKPIEEFEEGSPAWTVAYLLKDLSFRSVVTQWRLYTGDQRYDDIIRRYGEPYIRYRLTGDEQHLLDGIQPVLDYIRYNTPLNTYENPVTDRIYVADRYNNEGGPDQIKAMLTGDVMYKNWSPYMAVTWEGTDDTFTALVTDSGPDRLKVNIFSHADSKREGSMRLWQLEPGTYRFTQNSEDTEYDERQITVTKRGQRVPITLPSQTLLTLSLKLLP